MNALHQSVRYDAAFVLPPLPQGGSIGGGNGRAQTPQVRLECLHTHTGATHAAATSDAPVSRLAPYPRTSLAVPRHLTTEQRKRQRTETERRRDGEAERQTTGETLNAIRSPCAKEPRESKARTRSPVNSEPMIRAQ